MRIVCAAALAASPYRPLTTTRTAPRTIAIPIGGDRYTLAAGNLDSRQVQLNGTELALATNDELPTFRPPRCYPAT